MKSVGDTFFEWAQQIQKEKKLSRQVPVLALSVVHYEVSPGAVRHPLGPKIHHLWQGENSRSVGLVSWAQRGSGESLEEVDVATGSALSLARTAALHTRFHDLGLRITLVPGPKAECN